jgi:hypothetical protein
MALPRKLNIAGKNYVVRYFEDMIRVDKSGEEPLWGQCRPTDREIRVFNGRDAPDVIDTLIHESLHALLNERASIRVAIGDNEEAMVTDLAAAIPDFLVRNKLIRLDLVE